MWEDAEPRLRAREAVSIAPDDGARQVRAHMLGGASLRDDGGFWRRSLGATARCMQLCLGDGRPPSRRLAYPQQEEKGQLRSSVVIVPHDAVLSESVQLRSTPVLLRNYKGRRGRACAQEHEAGSFESFLNKLDDVETSSLRQRAASVEPRASGGSNHSSADGDTSESDLAPSPERRKSDPGTWHHTGEEVLRDAGDDDRQPLASWESEGGARPSNAQKRSPRHYRPSPLAQVHVRPPSATEPADGGDLLHLSVRLEVEGGSEVASSAPPREETTARDNA